MIAAYHAFLASKQARVTPHGLAARLTPDAPLFPFQMRVTQWAIEQGRAALWLDTGLGKTRCQLLWAQHVVEQAGDCLILAPLSVGPQTAREAGRIGIDAQYIRDPGQIRPGITITNYERLHLLPLARFCGVVLDESSILKAIDGKTRLALTEACAHIPYRLCCTATPAPNDHMELANHAEFLGVMTRQEMLSTYFTHDGGATSQWRLKGHAVDHFWRWVASWAVALTHPSALGDTTPGYDLQPLTIHDHVLPMEGYIAGVSLFPMEANTLTEQRIAKRAGLGQRIASIARHVNNSMESWVLWCGLNDEGDALEASIPGSIQIAGKDTLEAKESRMEAFLHGQARVLISKVGICGFGINMQHCAHVGFVGLSHSFEQYYQAIRRCWRFGQTRPVHVHRWYLDIEAPIVRNLTKKEAESEEMKRSMERHLLQFFTIAERERHTPSIPLQLPAWLKEESYAGV